MSHPYDPGFTWPDPLPPPVVLEITNPLDGCTECGAQETVWLSPLVGRRCAEHAPPGAEDGAA